MNFTKIFGIGVITLGTMIATSAGAETINDDYVGAYYGYNPYTNQYETYTYDDIIGDGQFNISSMEATLGDELDVTIYTTYVDIVTRNDNITFGDLFLSTSGYSPTVPSDYDNHSNGESWEFALVMDDHSGATKSGTLSLFKVSDINDIILAENAGSSVYRAGQEVLFNYTDQTALGFGTWEIINGGIHFNFDDIDLLSLGIADLGFHWTMTCANDVIEGSINVVPEPATMLLFGAGLAGLAGLRSRRRKA